MGLSFEFAKYLCRRGVFDIESPHILCLGAQEIFFNDPWLTELVNEYVPDNRRKSAIEKMNTYKEDDKFFNHGPRKGKTLKDKYVFDVIANATVSSIDNSSFEDADIIYDLNDNIEDHTIHQKFDIVFDFGTSEHIFDIKHVFHNIHNFTKTGGLIAHILPANNFVDHGFFQISPTLLHDYYKCNNYKIIDINLVLEQNGSDFAPCFFHHYRPGSLMEITQGGLTDQKYLTVGIFQKQPQSTSGVIPTQRAYKKLWQMSQTQ